MRRFTGQFAIPLREVLPSRSRLRPTLIVPGVMLLLIFAVANAAGQCTGCNTTGAWTPPGSDPNGVGANWGYPQIHLALLHGNAPYHSYLISWAETNIGSTARGLHGWNPGDPEWSTYPAEAYLKSLGLSDTDVNLFCAGHSTLADGRLLVSGGHIAHDIGIYDARIFDPATRTWITPSNTMQSPRWYPTNTTLPSGNVVTFSGSRWYKTLTFGGSTNLAGAAASIDDIRAGQIRSPDVVWESPLGESPPWPSAREGHSAVFIPLVRRMFVFGGRNTAGNPLGDTWVLRYEQNNQDPYSYDWTQYFGGPGPRYGHVAVSGWSDNSMIVYGGKDDGGVVSNKVHRFRPDEVEGWKWDPELAQSGPSLPGARWGHAAAWDDDHQRMIVFGGRKSPTELADNKVYVLTVNGTAATWQEITPTGTGPTFFREGHSLVCDTQGYFRPGKTGGGTG